MLEVARRRPGVLLIAAIALLIIAALATAAVTRKQDVTEKYLQPQEVMLLPPGNDPRLIEVGVVWKKPGYCVGQFRAQATETASQVRLGWVVDHEALNGPCAGVGSGGVAWAELALKTPLGHRTAIRASDGCVLTVVPANAPPDAIPSIPSC